MRQNCLTSSPLLTLTREQRASLFAGRRPRIAYPGDRPCPIEPGAEYRLSERLSLKVTGVRRSKNAKQWELDYTVVDFRPVWMRRRLPRHSVAADEGDLDAAAVQRAAVESAYTPSVQDALDPTAEAVTPDYERELVMRKKLRSAEHTRQRRDRAEEQARDQVRTFSRELRALTIRMVRLGMDPAPIFADIKRQIRERQEELGEGQ